MNLILKSYLLLQLACLNHFQRNPLSHLAPIPPPQLGVAVKELPPAAQKLLLDSLGLSPRSTLGVETLREALQGLRAWKAGLRMLNAVALANGRKASELTHPAFPHGMLWSAAHFRVLPLKL